MRMLSLVTLIVLGLCLAYSLKTQQPPPKSTSYNGPATFISFHPDNDEDVPARWLLVCRVSDRAVAFPVKDEAVHEAAERLKAGQRVELHYDLPVKSAPGGGTELCPAKLRGIAPANVTDDCGLAMSGSVR